MQSSDGARRRARSNREEPTGATIGRAPRPRRLTAAERLVVGVSDGRGISARDARTVGGTAYVLEDAAAVLLGGSERASNAALGTHRQRAEQLLREVGLDEYISLNGRAASVCAFSAVAPPHAINASPPSRTPRPPAVVSSRAGCAGPASSSDDDDFFRTATAATGHMLMRGSIDSTVRSGGRRILRPSSVAAVRNCTPAAVATRANALIATAPTLPPELRHAFLRGRDGEASAYRLREWHRRGWPSVPDAGADAKVAHMAPLADWLDRWARVERHYLRAAADGGAGTDAGDVFVHNDGAALAAAVAIALLSPGTEP